MLSRAVKIVLVAVFTLLTLNGCNTARGFGQDVQHLGGAISRGASG
ncbi:entericidin A/B family lipoprotein [Biostraticola tofi]|nr:entericidin A/B family lipoprotein [Biostraticola tofi]